MYQYLSKYPLLLRNAFIVCILQFSGSMLLTADLSAETFSSCSTSIELTCGVPYWQAPAFADDLIVTNYNFQGCTNPGALYDGNDYRYQINVGPSSRDIRITLENHTTDMDILVFRSCGDASGSSIYSGCLGVGATRSNTTEEVIIGGVSGVIYIVVDGPHGYNNSGFKITVDCNYYAPFLLDCVTASTLTCGTDRWVPAPVESSYSSYNYDFNDCGRFYNNYRGNDHLFRIDAGDKPLKKMTILVTQMSADLDIFLFRRCRNGTSVEFSECVGISYESGTSSERLEIEDAVGEYYLIIDGFADYETSGFRIFVSCEDKADPVDCFTARTLYCGSSIWVPTADHDYINSSNYDLSSCFYNSQSYTGRDHLYRIDVGHGKSQDLEIELSNLHGDLDLLVFRSCGDLYGDLRLDHCAGYSVSSGSQSEKVVIKEARGIYYIVVDGKDPWKSSSYAIRTTCIERQIDLCLYASSISCGESRWVAAPHVNQVEERHYDYSSCTSFKNYGYTGYDHIYEVDAGLFAKDLIVKIEGLFANLDVFVFKECQTTYGNYSFRNCKGYGIDRGYEDEEVLIKDAVGRYYIVIDAPTTSSRSSYKISVDCVDPKLSFDCSDARFISCGDDIWSEAPTHNNMTTDHYGTASCTNYTDLYLGYDHFYAVDVGTRLSNVTIEMSNLVDDLDLLVFSECGERYDNIRLQSCKGYSNNDDAFAESVFLEGASGIYYIAIDAARERDRSSYKLSIDCQDYIEVEDEDEEDLADEEQESDQSDGPLICGTTISSTTVGRSSSFAAEDINACFESNLLYTGPDILIPFDVEDNSFSLIMTHEDVNLSLFVMDSDMNFMSIGCRGQNYSSDATVSNSDIIGEVYSPTELVEPGMYYALIEGYISRISSDFTLSLTCGNPTEVDTVLACESFVEGVNGIENQEMIYTLSDASEIVGFTGPEWNAEIQYETASTLSILVDNIVGDGTLGVFLRDMSTGEVIDYVHSEGSEVSLEADVSPGTYLITTDGWRGADLSYDVELSGCVDNTEAVAISTTRSFTADYYESGVTAKVSPNPFANQVRFDITSELDDVGSLRILSLDGRLITEDDINLSAGSNVVVLNKSHFSNYTGIMIYQLTVGEKILQGKMIRVN